MTIIQTDKKYYKKMWSKENLDRVGCKSKNPEKYIVSMINSLGVPESNDVAIDIGCGRGRHTKILLDKGYTTFGMDFSINAWPMAAARCVFPTPLGPKNNTFIA